jgi:hypothetical protein
MTLTKPIIQTGILFLRPFRRALHKDFLFLVAAPSSEAVADISVVEEATTPDDDDEDETMKGKEEVIPSEKMNDPTPISI